MSQSDYDAFLHKKFLNKNATNYRELFTDGFQIPEKRIDWENGDVLRNFLQFEALTANSFE